MSYIKKQLLPGEKLILHARQHPLVLLWPVFLNILALVLLIVLSVYFRKYWLFVLYLIPLVFFLWKFMTWHGREYILTDRRVVRKEGVLSVSSFDSPLDKINDVFYQQSFMGRLLKYGEVGLQTASEQGTTVFEFLSRPLAFKNSIVRQRELYRLEGAAAGAPRLPSVPQLLEELASLRDRNIISETEFIEKKKKLLDRI